MIRDLPHLLFASAIAGWCAWFGYDAWLAQRGVENLILIVPGAVAAISLYAVIAVQCVRAVDAPAPASPGRHGGGKVVGTMALLAAYAVAGPTIGFDISSFVYILAMLLFLGERRILVLLLVPALFCAVVISLFGIVLATPLPLLLFPGEPP
jgi:hypothetical protein